MSHLQVRIVDDPVSKIVRKLYLRCLSCTWIVVSVKYRDEPGLAKIEKYCTWHLRLLKAEGQESVKRVTAVWQECPHRKPDWKEWNCWCVSKKIVKCLWMCLSSGLVRTERFEIGRQSFRSVEIVFVLETGIMAAIVQISGDSFCFRDWNYFSSLECGWKKTFLYAYVIKYM